MIDDVEFSRLLEGIECERKSRASFLVALDGPGGSGKSTLASRLSDNRADVAIVRVDDFYAPIAEGERASLSDKEGYERDFGRHGLSATCLSPSTRIGKTLEIGAHIG